MSYDLEKMQIDSMKWFLNGLDYHFFTFAKFEKTLHPFNKTIPHEERIKSHGYIKYEVEAYISRLFRFRSFFHNIKRRLNISRPDSADLLEIWDSFEAGGVITKFRNKWIAHRSYDDPRHGDTEDTHAEVLINLEGSGTFWEDNHFIIYFDKSRFDICDYHNKFKSFFNWFMEKIKEDQSVK